MKKSINSVQKANAEYSCQACWKNEAVLKIQGSGWMLHIQGKFCGPCAIQKIKYWYRNDIPASDLCLECASAVVFATHKQKITKS